ncbi:MAG TPA: hypothetical protein VFA20_26325 [Myxococcaceae bacterium]|nr:hypothetical protein [Myxococcaceae bacterium]
MRARASRVRIGLWAVALGLALACVLRGERKLLLNAEEASSPRAQLRSADGLEIAAFLTATGDRKACERGKARRSVDPQTSQELVRITCPPGECKQWERAPAVDPKSGREVTQVRCRAGQEGAPGQEYTLRPEEIGALVLPDVNVVGSVLVTVLVIAGSIVGALALLLVIALLSSCPFIYSWDGKQYVLDGEPYGGATVAAFERTDSSELEHLAAVGGRYRLLLTNEMDETQHTNNLELLEIDHPEGSKAVMDRQGGVHAFRDLRPPVRASDERGADLTGTLAQEDRRTWTADLDDLATRLPLNDTRNHLTLEFERPAGGGPVYLVTGASTGMWGATMLRTLLSLRGNQLEAFYAAVNASPSYQEEIRRWGEREELFTLAVQVQVGDRWERRGVITGGGPVAPELRAVPLDLHGVNGQRIRIKLDPPMAFWTFDSLRLGSEEQAVQMTVQPALSARDQDGRDVRAELNATDDRFLVQPKPGDFTEVQFAASPAKAGLRRTVFARTRGWYQVHVDQTAPPDEESLQRLASEPGWMVQRALSDFAELKRTGVLRGVNPVLIGRPLPLTRPDPFAPALP